MSHPSLVDALALVPDPRKHRGRRHPLVAVLSLTVVAVLAGMKSLEAIAQFGRDHGAPLAHALGFRRAKTPTKSMLSVLFRALDVAAFERAIQAWLAGRQADGDAWRVLALDGKTLRGSRDGEVPAVHLLSAFAPAAAAVLAQLRVAATTNEHKAGLRLLRVLPVAGKVVTADAMFTHRDVAAAIVTRGGDYVLPVKDNQAVLRDQIRAALDDHAAFSPLPAEGGGGRRAGGADGRQGARAGGDAAAAEYHPAEWVPGLAGGGAGV